MTVRAGEEEIRGALAVVGGAARRLGVGAPDLHVGAGACGPVWHLRPIDPRPDPDLAWLGPDEAIGWSALASWIEGGLPPVVRIGSGRRPTGWTVQLGGRASTLALWSLADAAAVCALARALIILRRWTRSPPPWGLRDAEAERLELLAREASILAEGGPRPWAPISAPWATIPDWYLRAFGTASE